MRVVEHVIERWNEPVRLFFIGDLHLGHTSTDEALIADTCEQLRQPDTYWINLGDTIDAINRSDPRFDPRSLADWIGVHDLTDIAAAQIARYRHYFRDLGGNCLATIEGNHEAAMQKHSERAIYAGLNAAIDLEHDRALGISGFVRLRFREVTPGGKHKNTWTQTVYVHHGFGGGRLIGAKAIKLQRLPSSYVADLYAMGHTHTKVAFKQTVMAVSPRKAEVEERQICLINTGAFMGLAGYAEAKGYQPQERGPVWVTFYPAERRVEVTQ